MPQVRTVMKKSYKIPFDPKGDLHEYPVEYPAPHNKGNSIWVDNYEFEDTLSLEGWGRGRSSVTFQMKRLRGGVVSVFVSDFFDMALNMVNGSIQARFTFCKKGQNYGCKLVGK